MLTKLTENEVQLLHLVADGKNYLEMQKLLNLSYASVARHLAYVKIKLNAKTLPQAVYKACCLQILSLEKTIT